MSDIQIPGLPGPTTNSGYGPQSISASAGLLALGSMANMGPGNSEAMGSHASLLMRTMTLSDTSSGYYYNAGLDCSQFRDSSGNPSIANVDGRCMFANSDESPPCWMSPTTVPLEPTTPYDLRPPTFQPINPY